MTEGEKPRVDSDLDRVDRWRTASFRMNRGDVGDGSSLGGSKPRWGIDYRKNKRCRDCIKTIKILTESTITQLTVTCISRNHFCDRTSCWRFFMRMMMTTALSMLRLFTAAFDVQTEEIGMVRRWASV
jgi:hypothetical protein